MFAAMFAYAIEMQKFSFNENLDRQSEQERNNKRS